MQSAQWEDVRRRAATPGRGIARNGADERELRRKSGERGATNNTNTQQTHIYTAVFAIDARLINIPQGCAEIETLLSGWKMENRFIFTCCHIITPI